jgi:hypothetical protein
VSSGTVEWSIDEVIDIGWSNATLRDDSADRGGVEIIDIDDGD